MGSVKKLPPLSEAQLEIMNVVWDRGECSVADVLDVLQGRRGVTRSTVQTMITRLDEKGWLVHRERTGGYLYTASVDREAAQQYTVKKMVETVFDGSAEGLVLALLGSCELSSGEIERIRKLISDAKQRKTR